MKFDRFLSFGQLRRYKIGTLNFKIKIIFLFEHFIPVLCIENADNQIIIYMKLERTKFKNKMNRLQFTNSNAGLMIYCHFKQIALDRKFMVRVPYITGNKRP